VHRLEVRLSGGADAVRRQMRGFVVRSHELQCLRQAVPERQFLHQWPMLEVAVRSSVHRPGTSFAPGRRLSRRPGWHHGALPGGEGLCSEQDEGAHRVLELRRGPRPEGERTGRAVFGRHRLRARHEPSRRLLRPGWSRRDRQRGAPVTAGVIRDSSRELRAEPMEIWWKRLDRPSSNESAMLRP